MAHPQMRAVEFIQYAFSPMIAVATTPVVDQICKKNNLTFIELLQPFCKLSEAVFKDPSGGSSVIKNLRINLVDINARPPQPTLAREFLNYSVSIPSENIRTQTFHARNKDIEIPLSLPWFDSWREIFLQVQFPLDHEFTRHYLGCMFVIASHENNVIEQLDLLIQHMDSLQNASQAKVPKWITNNVLKYIIVIYDSQESNNVKTIELMDVLKQKYGANNCHCLIINSRLPTSGEVNLPDPWVQFLTRRPTIIRRSNSAVINNDKWAPRTPVDITVGVMPSSINETVQTSIQLEVGQEANETSSSNTVMDHPLSPEMNENRQIVEEEDIPPLHKNVWFGSPSVSLNVGVHGACLLMEDIENIKRLVQEFGTKSLIPYAEKLVMQLTETLANKKGVSRSIFSATKRWFTPNKPGASGNASQINAFMYSPDSNEVLQRKLADIYFIFENYNAAYQLYYQLKKDFSLDQAYLYLAGALEMAALSIFMENDVTKKFFEYMEESINLYLNVCKMPQFATRATLFSTECLRAKNLFGEAANQYIKMTSEDSDLRSALLLEQAAYCFLYCSRPVMIRKYAFHIVLAGHRFSKCNQRKHSLRCYKQALEVYNKTGWSLAHDHIHFTIGRQASLLNLLGESVFSYTSLLQATSRQFSHQLAIFLKEYLNTYRAYIVEKEENEGLTELPTFIIPQVLFYGLQVLIGPGLPLRAPGRVPASGLNFNVDINDPSHARFNKMEEHILTNLHGGALKKHLTYCKTGETQISIMGIIGELIQVKVTLVNILNIPLLLKNVFLLWTFKSTENGNELVVTNEMKDLKSLEIYAKTHVIENVSIAPLASQEVVLVITPLADGKIYLNGIAYALVSPLPVENPTIVNGKQPIFLAKPKKSPEPYVFATSNLNSFVVSIAPTAPALQVTFNEISQDQLAHEIIPVCVEIRNTGTAPLKNIHLATMFPNQVSIYLEKDGRTIYLPVLRKTTGSQLIMWQLTNTTFVPGSSMVFYMNILTPYYGREGVIQTLNSVPTVEVLFYYENAFDDFPRYRVVRHQWQFSIQESLDVNIQCQPSYGHNEIETVDLCLTATNNNQDHSAVITEITLNQISLISNNWTLVTNTPKPRSIKLQSQEQVHLLLKTSRKLNKEKNTTKISLVTEKLNKEMECVCEDFATKNSGLEEDDENKNEALLVVRWLATVTDSEGNKRNTVGQNHVPIKNLSSFINKEKIDKKNKAENTLIERIPLKPDVKNLAILQKQVTYNMIHPSKVTHNFKNELICIIPVSVVIHSAASSLLEVKINTLGTSTESQLPLPRHELSNPQSLLNFRWVGHSEILISLEPYTSKNLSLMAAFTSSGTYDLAGRLELLCRPPSSPYDTVMQNISFDSSIIIEGIA